MPQHIAGISLALFLSSNVCSLFLIITRIFFKKNQFDYLLILFALLFIYFNYFYVKHFIRESNYKQIISEHGQVEWINSWQGHLIFILYVVMTIILFFLNKLLLS